MRSRAIALLTAVGVATTPAAILAANAPAKATNTQAGRSCSPKNKAPSGFSCKKNSKGKYVLTAKKKKSGGTTTGSR